MGAIPPSSVLGGNLLLCQPLTDAHRIKSYRVADPVVGNPSIFDHLVQRGAAHGEDAGKFADAYRTDVAAKASDQIGGFVR